MPALAGVNRFLWNRRLPGVPNVLAGDLEPWNRGDGAMVVPGTYAVAMTVDGKTQTQSFGILRDKGDQRVLLAVGQLAKALQQFALVQRQFRAVQAHCGIVIKCTFLKKALL